MGLKDNMTKDASYCRQYGHDWYIHIGIGWDKAECWTCGRVIRDMIIRPHDLPDWRHDNE